MMVFEYKCGDCGTVHEIPKEQPIGQCKICNGELFRIFSIFGINGFADSKAIEATEKKWQKEHDKKQREYDDSRKEIDQIYKDGEKMFGELMVTRTDKRRKHLERRSTPGTREHQEYKEHTGMVGD